MNSLAFWLNAAVFALCLSLLYRVFVRVVRKKACFAMYGVRDELIYLVATGALLEDGQVFRHYYDRTNELLAAAPDIGIDRLLAAIFAHRRDGREFEEILRRATRMAERLFNDPAFDDPEVRRVVSAYYQAVQGMILSHSSILRVLNITLAHVATRVRHRVVPHLPGRYRRAMEAVEYTDQEARLVHERRAWGAC